MAIVRSTRKAGDPLTPEQIARLDALKDRPSVYDPECPPLTDEQLAEFMPVNGTWEERAERMKAAGIVDPELRIPSRLVPAE
ncbi:hypothetical protein FACS1894172_10510 [Spirochaetia bacterium]|nr:hypothetical protein FACS1894164_10470 [Spirochaetia bacterium]GHU32943.1 hypothetical protein FACS1894172_10510 [Spirochaetia bacterium]